MFSLAIYSAYLVMQLLLSALTLWWTARWTRSSHATFRRGVVATIVLWIYSILALLLDSYLEPMIPPLEVMLLVAVPILTLAVLLFFDFLFIRYIFHLKTARSLCVLAAYFLINGGIFCLGWFVVRPTVVEAFVSTSNTMAPSINGTHLVGVCTKCGGTAIVPKNNFGFNDRSSICSNCFAVNSVDPLRIFTVTQEADRFVMNRWLKPRRWDVVVYRSKDDGTRLIAQRLVGLPGDTIMIRDGAIWIDGVKLVPPDQVGPVQYVADSIDESIITFGPLTLDSGEYFVMGDFSRHSLDSRREGPVPESNIVGVIDLIYLPVKRFRILR